MASDDKKAKAAPAAKPEAVPTKKNVSASKDKSPPNAEPSKAESGETAAALPTRYSRGEGQKPVSQAYKDNWNAIYGKKKKKR